jgi:hypothetical protein
LRGWLGKGEKIVKCGVRSAESGREELVIPHSKLPIPHAEDYPFERLNCPSFHAILNKVEAKDFSMRLIDED